ncbi:MAG TPA: glycosyltransferase family 39 protein [Marmoricola sp.]|nr:glycosyltransferase family 39 protein [Marmoricola sp.]
MRALGQRPAVLVAALTGVLLLVVSGRYGYHRDELYFVQAGHHLAWGYPDQPPLVPLVARLMTALAPDSLTVLRLPSALLAMAAVLLAGAMARRLGASRSGELLAALATALSGFVLAMGHTLSTSTFDLVGWTIVTYLLVRLLQGADRRLWLLAGLVAGLTMQANVLVGFLLAGFVVAVLAAGPRAVLRSAWPWSAAALALLLALPYLVWQASHGWPQLDVANGIAHGDSGSSAPRAAFVPLVLLQTGPFLAPIWITGLVRLWRDPRVRCLAVTFVVLLVVFVALGGKPYYLAGLFPLLFAAGSQPLLDKVWRWVVPALLVLSLPVLLITLPVLPVRSSQPAIDVNYDLGETIGWPQFTSQVAAAYERLPAGTVIVTGNYGQAGAVDRYGPALGLPHAFSGHNGYGLWGRPPGASPALMIGIDPDLLETSCASLRTVGRIHSAYAIDNDEDGTALSYCVPAHTWHDLWPSFRHIG